MRRGVGLRVLTAAAVVIVLLGLAATAFFLYSEQFSSAVLCDDPEDFACSGHWVYGVGNEVWSIGVVVVGTALLVLSIRLLRRVEPPRRPPA